jgi:DMSO/TMAO reductase YedYZ molybdopterin-dependent catalytic subunit
MNRTHDARRRFLARTLGAAGSLFVAGCERLSHSDWAPKVLGAGEQASSAVAHALTSRKSMAQEFTDADRSPTFRSNGTAAPDSDVYRRLASGAFADYRLEVGGLVAQPATFTLAELRALPSRTQITRHDCVEGWSAIGKWKGARLAALLEAVQPKPEARFVMFYCADPMEDDGTSPYYESIDLEDAFHPQTILAYEMNDAVLPIANGAPIRLRVERQLGYKHAKYVMRIELVDSFNSIAGGKGGYWEDQGYQWFAGI